MPIYVRYCPKCQIDWEIKRPVEEFDAPYPCPDCEGPTDRIPAKTSFQLKGHGWYRDGYGNKKPNSD